LVLANYFFQSLLSHLLGDRLQNYLSLYITLDDILGQLTAFAEVNLHIVIVLQEFFINETIRLSHS
jgi:small basic protein